MPWLYVAMKDAAPQRWSLTTTPWYQTTLQKQSLNPEYKTHSSALFRKHDILQLENISVPNQSSSTRFPKKVDSLCRKKRDKDISKTTLAPTEKTNAVLMVW